MHVFPMLNPNPYLSRRAKLAIKASHQTPCRSLSNFWRRSSRSRALADGSAKELGCHSIATPRPRRAMPRALHHDATRFVAAGRRQPHSTDGISSWTFADFCPSCNRSRAVPRPACPAAPAIDSLRSLCPRLLAHTLVCRRPRSPVLPLVPRRARARFPIWLPTTEQPRRPLLLLEMPSDRTLPLCSGAPRMDRVLPSAL